MAEVSGLRLALYFSPYTQKVVAKKLGINNCILSQYSLGRRPIAAKHLMILASFFERDPNELLQFYESPYLEEVG
jgi:transcriptional regulator with XRE-family HTH domain